MRMDLATVTAITGLVALCAFFAWIIVQHGLLFYREATGPRKLSTLVGAAAVIAIIINILVGTFTQPAPVLTRPATQSPAKKPVPSHDGLREPLPVKP